MCFVFKPTRTPKQKLVFQNICSSSLPIFHVHSNSTIFMLFVLRFYISYHKQNTVAVSTTLSKHHAPEVWETSQK